MEESANLKLLADDPVFIETKKTFEGTAEITDAEIIELKKVGPKDPRKILRIRVKPKDPKNKKHFTYQINYNKVLRRLKEDGII